MAWSAWRHSARSSPLPGPETVPTLGCVSGWKTAALVRPTCPRVRPKKPPGADAITTAMRRGMRWGVRKRSLPRGVCGSIQIDHVPARSLPIPPPTRRRAERRCGHQIIGTPGPSCLTRG